MPEVKNIRDKQSFIIGGLFILGLIFAIYSYFNNAITSDSITESEEPTTLEKLKEIISTSTEREEESLLGASTEEQPESTQETSIWVATDYQEGDIGKGGYEVKRGDTLWEIADGVYGNGAEWTKILEANADEVGFLPSGEQALIMPGQILVIP